MTIYVDPLRSYPHKRKQYAHMISSLDNKELHEFAKSIGVKRHWFHKNHYDLREADWQNAVKAGAEIVTSKKLVLIGMIRDLRKSYPPIKWSMPKGFKPL